MPAKNKNLISTKEAGQLVGRSSDYVARLVRAEKIDGEKIGGTWLVEKDSLLNFFDLQEAQLNAQKEKLSSIRKQEYKESQDLIPKTKKFIETEIAHGVFTAHNLIAMTASVLLVFGGYLTVQAGPVKHFVSEIKEEVISAIYVVRREAAETLYSPKQVANLYNARSVNYVDVEPVIPNTFSVIENAVKEGGYGAGALREKYTVNDTQPLLQKVSLRDVSNSIFENYRAVGHAFLNAGLSFERAYLNGVYVFSGGLLDTGSVIASASDAAVDAYISSVYGFVNLAQAYPQTWIGGVYGFVDATPVVAHRIASVPYVVGDTLVDSVATLPKLQERFAYGVAENAPEVARSVTATTLNVGEEFVETSEKITQVYKQNVERVGEVGGSGYVYARITAPQILEDKVRVAAYRGGRAVAGVFEGVSEDVANRIASIVSGVLETQDYIVRVGKSVADTVVGVPSNTVARVSLPQEAGVVSAVQNFFGNLFGNKREPVLLVTQGALETKITEEVAEPVVTPVRTTPVTNNFYSFTDASVTQGYVDANLAALRSFILAEIDSLDVSVERSDGENYDNILDTLSDAVNGDLSPSSLTTTGTVTAGSFVGGTGSFATTTISNLTVSGDTTFSGTLTVGGLTTTGPLSAPYFSATSTTATSTFAGGLNVGSGSFVYDLNSGNVGIGTTTPFTDFAVEGNSYFNGTLGVSGALTGSTASFSGLVVTNATTTSATTTNLAISGLTAGSVPFIGTGGVVREDNDNFFFDAVNGRLGIGTSTPRSSLDIEGTDAVRIPVGTTAQRPSFSLAGQIRYNTSTAQYEGFDGSNWRGLGGVIDIDQDTYITAEENTDEDFLRFYTAGGERFTITNTGNVGVGTSSPYARFSVVGQTVSEYFTATSTSIASVFPLLSSTSATSTQLAVSSLTSGRVPFVTAGGRLVDSANFTFDGSVATITDVISTRATTTNATSTNLSISNTLNLSGLTASRGLFLDANNNVVDSAASSALANSLTDETGTGSVVFSASPTLTGTTIIADASITNATSTTLDVTGNLRLPNLTPSRLVALTANGTLTNSDLASWVSGTSNQVTVTDDGDGSITLSLPSTLSFTDFTAVNGTTTNATSTNLAIESLTSGRIPFATAGGRLVDSSSLTFDGTIITAPQVVASSATATSTFAGGLAVETSGLVYDWQTNRVGIGTAGPTSKLHIEGSGQIADFDGTNDTGAVYARFGTSGSSGLGFVGVEGSSAGVINTDTLAYATYIGAAASGTSLQFGTPGGVRMTINPSGNVGIGTTNPSTFKLQVAGNVGPDADSTYDLGSDAVRWANIFTDAFVATRGTTTNATSTNLAVSGSISVPADSFGTNEIQDVYLLNTGDTATGDYNFDSNTLFIDSGDNRVGIGTNNPLKGLHVQQGGSSGLTSAFGDGLLFSTNSASGARIFLDNLGGAANEKAVALVNENVNGVGTLYFGSLSDSGASWVHNHLLAFRLDNGYVGIGTSTPYAKLSVAGSVVGEYFTATSTSIASTFPLLSSTNATSTQLAVSSLTSGRVPYATTGGRLIDSSTFTFDGTTATITDLINTRATTTSATSTNFYTTNFGVNSEYINDLTGNGLAISGGKLNVATSSLASGFFLQDGNSFGATAVLGTNDSNDLAFETGGTTRVTIDTDGDLGIASTTPVLPLSVAASRTYRGLTTNALFSGSAQGFQFQAAGGSQAAALTGLNGEIRIYNDASASSGNWASSDETAIFTTSNTFGVGTSTPWAQVSVEGQGGRPGFVVSDSSNNTDFVVAEDGDVGIGSSAPLGRLYVTGSATQDVVIKGTGATDQTIQFGRTDSATNWIVGRDNTSSVFGIEYQATTGLGALTSAQAFTISQAGDVGIGSSTPAARLGVKGGGTGNDVAFAVSDSANSNLLLIQEDGDTVFGPGVASIGQAQYIFSGADNSNVVAFTDNSGNFRHVFGTDASAEPYWRSFNNKDLHFGINSTDTVHLVYNSGDDLFSVGSTTPYAKLTVQNTGTQPSFIVEDSSSDTSPFIIDAGGRVGVGTAAPGNKISILIDSDDGISLVRSGWGTASGIFLDDDDQGQNGLSIVGPSSRDITFSLNGNDSTDGFTVYTDPSNGSSADTFAFGVFNNGNVGIGVADPETKLEVAGGNILLSNNQALQFEDTSGTNRSLVTLTSGDVATFGLANNVTAINGFEQTFTSARTAGNGADEAFLFTTSNDLGASDEVFQIGDAGGNMFTVLGNGYVGIGNITPSNQLTVGGTDGQSNALISARSPAGGNSFEFGHGNSAGYGSTIGNQVGNGAPFIAFNAEAGTTNNTYRTRGVVGTVIRGGLNGGLVIGSVTDSNADNQSLTARVTLDSAGQVGIGITPSYELDVIGTARFGLNEDLTPDASGLVGQILIDGNAYAGYIAMDGTAQYLGHNSASRGLFLQTDETTRLAIEGTGDVGINTTDPDAKLDIVGTTSGTGGVNQALQINGNWGFRETGNTLIFESNNSGTWSPAFTSNRATGNVGIGTSTPQTNLSVSDRSQNANGTLFTQLTLATGQNLSSGTVGGGNLIGFEMFGGGVSTGAIGGYMAGQSNYGIGVWGGTNTGNPHLFVNNSGNVGIGTTTPTASLYIKSPSGTNPLTIDANSASSDSNRALNFNIDGLNYGKIIVPSGSGGAMAFWTGSAGAAVERVRITNTGNVGIGTTSPASKFVVSSNASSPSVSEAVFANQSTASGAQVRVALDRGGDAGSGLARGGVFYSTSGTFGIADYEAREMAFLTGTSAGSATKRLVITNDGNIGIGDTSPDAKLDITTSDQFALRIDNAGTGDGIRSTLAGSNNHFLGYDSVTGNNTINLWQSGDAGRLYLLDGGTSNIQLLADGNSYFNGGNVGIGTTTPVSDLHVIDTITGRAGAGYLIKQAFRNTGLYVESDNDLSVFNGGGRYITFEAGSAHTGIGTDNPSSLLDVAGTVEVSAVGATEPGIFGDASGTFIWGVGREVNGMRLSSLDDFYFYTGATSNTTGTQRLIIDHTTGNVGIGTDAPGYKLHVLGDVAATSFVNISTREAKKGITYLDEARKEDILEQIKAVDIAEYRYEYESNSNPLRLGLIAEEAPVEILSVGGKGVDIYKLATFTLAAVQQLAVKVETLEERVALLEAQVAAGGSGSGSGFSTSTITAFFAELGILIEKGFAQFDKLAFRELVATEGVAGAAAAGSVTILEGNKVVEVENAQVLESSKIFVTFTSSLEGGWFIAEKQNGSFRVELDREQDADVSFDYFILQTERSRVVEGGGESEGGAPAHPGGPEPVITIIGDNPMNVAYDSTFVDPGAYITDDVDPDISYDVYINGLRKEVNPLNTRDVGEHEVTYHAVDDDGNVVSVTRIVNVLPEGETAPEEEVVEETPEEEVVEETPVEEEVVEETSTEEPAPEEEVVEEVADTVAPVITLNGKAAIKLDVGASFTDPGATATDAVDGDVTSSITVSGAVDTSKAGVYTLTYSVADAAGNEASTARTVTVSVPATTSTEPAQTPEETVVE